MASSRVRAAGTDRTASPRRISLLPRGARTWHLAGRLVILLAAVFVSGCGVFGGSGVRIEVVSLEDAPARLEGDLRTAIYRHHDANTMTVVFSDLSLDDLRQGRFGNGRIICVDMHWRPKAGATPVDRTGTNCTVRQVIFAGDAAGIYDGAGFLAPAGKGGERTIGGSITGATLRLARSTDGFADALGAAELSGSFTARRDDAAVNQIAVRLNTEVTRRLGTLFYVLGY